MNHSGEFSYIEWSDEDQVWIGYCPSLFIGGVCHCASEFEARVRLDKFIVEEVRDLQEAVQKTPDPAR
jgi:hypothetical protein